MSDITLCANIACTKRGTCQRWLTPASDWQSMAMFQPVDGVCENYLNEPDNGDEPAKTEW